ncbi:MAG: peptidase M23 [Saprospiraceae bacterium]|nr:MAG: peptidase M23 [Saprospiraceae bacterium]
MAEDMQKRSRWDRLTDSYRLIIMNRETFEEVGAYNLSPLNVYIFLSSLLVAGVLLAWLAFSFTPLGRLLPTNHNIDPETLVKLYNDLDSLEQLTAAQELYNERFRRMLTGQVQYEPEDAPPTNHYNDSLLAPLPLSEEELALRQEIDAFEMDAENADEPLADGASVNVSPRTLTLQQLHFAPPISGTITAGFNPQRQHYGVDVVAPKNTPIKATLDGWVIFADWTLETGNTIVIQHPRNIVSIYKHNSSLLKKTGTFVRAGEAIAIIGNTGELTDGPHLHFELWHEGKPVDPTNFVDFK